MSFFENVGKKISDVSQSTVQKGKEIAEITKLNSKVSEEERKIANTYKEIGKLYYETFGENPDGVFVEFVQAIKDSEAVIAESKAKIEEIKSVGKCPNCGAAVKPGTAFCVACGSPVADVNAAAPVAPAQPVAPQPRFCTGCGNEIQPGTLFCTRCGKPVEDAAAPAQAYAPVEPAQAYAPVEPAQAYAPVEPAQAYAPVEPTQAYAPVEPAQAYAPVEPAQAYAPVEPTQAYAPVEPTQAYAPVEPTQAE